MLGGTLSLYWSTHQNLPGDGPPHNDINIVILFVMQAAHKQFKALQVVDAWSYEGKKNFV